MSNHVNAALLKGVIDLHVHSAPDTAKRTYSDIELANAMKKVGARAVVIKSHSVPTMDRALIAREVTGFEVYGALALNRAVGGFNPWAVENAIKMGAKIIWMPTFDADYFQKRLGKSGLRAVVDNHLAEHVEDILKLIAGANILLATGHIGPDEQLILIERAKELGVQKIMVDHPEQAFMQISVAQQKEMIEKFGVYVERCCAYTKDFDRAYEISAAAINELGYQSTVIATDAGVTKLPPWEELMTEYLEAMLALGISQDKIDVMVKKNPAYLLGLEN